MPETFFIGQKCEYIDVAGNIRDVKIRWISGKFGYFQRHEFLLDSGVVSSGGSIRPKAVRV